MKLQDNEISSVGEFLKLVVLGLFVGVLVFAFFLSVFLSVNTSTRD